MIPAHATGSPRLIGRFLPLFALGSILGGLACSREPSSSSTGTPPDTLPDTVADTTSAPLALGLATVATGLSNPVHVAAPAGDPRLFIVEQRGRIRIVKDGALLATPFLDITSRVVFGGERGLLSVAFDPAYATNGRFYVYYTGAQNDIVVDRHVASPDADVASAEFQRVITIPHRSAGNHNGGLVTFGPDGYLYLATGDGGGAGDQENNAQNLTSLLGKLLRIDVRNLPYEIPPDNPFVNAAGADEIWAYGLRNPWRFAFDGPAGGAVLWIADVGQNRLEEINAIGAGVAGVNYGWRVMEGRSCFNPASGCDGSAMTLPVHEYSHDDGCSITGGAVYRGQSIPPLQGHYFYADYCRGWIRSLRLVGGAVTDHREWPLGSAGNITSFGLDGAGELHVATTSGAVYRIVRQ